MEASDKVVGEIKLGLSQLSHIVLSHAASIKSLEAYLLALSVQMHNSIKGNDQICMAITIESSHPYVSRMGSDTPLFMEIKECRRINKGEVKENNIIPDKLKIMCDVEDGDRLIGAKPEMI